MVGTQAAKCIDRHRSFVLAVCTVLLFLLPSILAQQLQELLLCLVLQMRQKGIRRRILSYWLLCCKRSQTDDMAAVW
jgi:hypothetical protein